MNSEQAINLVRDTFTHSFNETRFRTFIRNLLNGLTETDDSFISGSFIRQAFANNVSSYKRIAKYKPNATERLDVLMVKLKANSSLDRARTLQRNFVADYLKQRGNKEGALVAFYCEGSSDWRFSYIKVENSIDLSSGIPKTITELSPAKRLSFLVGENEPNHTALKQIAPLLEREDIHTLSTIENAFNIESITDEFFQKYKELFLKLKDELDSILAQNPDIKTDFEEKNIFTEHFAKKLLGQIVFLYFLQKKGWLGVGRDEEGKFRNWGSGPKNFMRKLFNEEIIQYDNFFDDILEPLFYEALASKHENSFYSKFNCKIPFLNGGLFEPINGYNWQETVIRNNNDILKEILETFDLYNFTVKEDEPFDKEVAIDPEMLGKVFENLLEVKDRKSKGAFYTPREIVHYMCQESLINYLDVKLNTEIVPLASPKVSQRPLFGESNDGVLTEDVYVEKVPRKDIEEFVRHGDFYIDYALRNKTARENGKTVSGIYKERELPQTITQRADIVDGLLNDIKICDPAIGSGAFPVGLMHEIVRSRYALSDYGEYDPEKTFYNFKRHAIQSSIYGVDIDSGAIDIAKLRLWLSLIVDEDDFGNIQPLPNLDYKIVCGNSLLGLDLDNLFIDEALKKIELLKEQYFGETDHDRKKKLHKGIDQILFEITEQKNSFDFKIHFSEVFHQNAAQASRLCNTHTRDEYAALNGFDVVIGNPPYVQLQKFKGNPIQKAYKDRNYEVHDSNGDIYCLFYEKGIKSLAAGGTLCFITSNKWMRAGYGEKLRLFFLKYNPIYLIDLGPGVFKSATVDTNILIIGNCPNKKQLSALSLSSNLAQASRLCNANSRDDCSTLDIARAFKEKSVPLPKLTKDAWFIGSSAEQLLKAKIEKIGKPLKNWDVKIYRGVLTGLNEAFIIDTPTKERLCAEDPKSAEILKPILRGRDIKRYSYDWAGLWLIQSGFDMDVPNLYPAIYKHLLLFEEKARKRDDQGSNWWNLRACAYYPEFEKEKIIYPNMTKYLPFIYDDEGFYTNQKCFIMTGNNLRYLTGYFNSSIAAKWIRENCPELQGGTRELSKIFFENISIPPITAQPRLTTEKIESLVDNILSAKKSNSSADTSKLESEIDQLVYKLYDLTPAEIAIIEGKEHI